MPWPKKKSAQSGSPPDSQQTKDLPTLAIIAVMLAAIVIIGVGLWLLKS
ncbi:hypothetical protein [Arthrobacter sp. efr-133-TYG-118]|nr:hypothetical protein [Arthrobacter sp. efr-133-TYG-118]